MTRITGTLHENVRKFLILSRSVLRMGNVLDKSYRENQNTHFLFNDFFANRAVYEVMWKNIVEPGRPQMTIWRMRIACWIRKAINNHSKYLMLNAFPLQQRLHERTSM